MITPFLANISHGLVAEFSTSYNGACGIIYFTMGHCSFLVPLLPPFSVNCPSLCYAFLLFLSHSSIQYIFHFHYIFSKFNSVCFRSPYLAIQPLDIEQLSKEQVKTFL
jgi:hypothetical protein